MLHFVHVYFELPGYYKPFVFTSAVGELSLSLNYGLWGDNFTIFVKGFQCRLTFIVPNTFYCRFRQVLEDFEIPILEDKNRMHVKYYLAPPGAKV